MEIYIRVVYDLPYSVKGFTAFDADGNANIYINGNRPPADQYEALEHEMFHIDADHWQCPDVVILEREVHDAKSEKTEKRSLEHPGL